MNKIAVYSHADCLVHDTGPGHPESPARVSSILAALKICPFASKLDFLQAPMGKREDVLLVHPETYVKAVENAVPHDASLSYLDPDTVLSRGSLKAALRAVGSACDAVDRVIQGDYKSAFCAVRPPGHHALADHAMGFCIFNSVAIAAHHAQKKHKLKRLAIVDFDVHHGNGTEAIFAQDADVLYVSTHQWPNYPGTGEAEETGVGNILNVPMPPGTAGTQYRRRFSATVIAALEAFRPELILVSAGFDAHRDDPLADMNLSEDDYRWIGDAIAQIAQKSCKGRVISMLEGGYNLHALAASAESYLSAFC